MLASFLFGVLVGIALVIYILFRVLVQGEKGEKVAQLRFVQQGGGEQPVQPAASVDGGAVPAASGAALGHLGWFNHLLRILFVEMLGDEGLQRIIKMKLQKALNEDRNSFLNEIKVRHFSCGDNFLQVSSGIRCTESEAYEMEARFDVKLVDASIRFHIETSVALPFGKILPVKIMLEMREMIGSAVFLVPRGRNPRCLLGFESNPLIVVHIESDVGGMLEISSLPKVAHVFEKKIAELLSEALVTKSGGGFFLHLPIPYIRKAYFVPCSKERAMLRKGVNMTEKLKTPVKKILDLSRAESMDLETLKRKKAVAFEGLVNEAVANERLRQSERDKKEQQPAKVGEFEDDGMIEEALSDQDELSVSSRNSQTSLIEETLAFEPDLEDPPPVPSRNTESYYLSSTSEPQLRKRDKLAKMAAKMTNF